MMKRTFAGILTAMVAISLCAVTAFAAGPRCGRYHADADGDGVCDICGAYHRCGVAGAGWNFVDADGDGVCDNAASCRGSGCGRGFHGGHGNGFRGGYGR